MKRGYVMGLKRVRNHAAEYGRRAVAVAATRGVWMLHRRVGDLGRGPDKGWTVTHQPSGCYAVRSDTKRAALAAMRALDPAWMPDAAFGRQSFGAPPAGLPAALHLARQS